MSTQLHLANSIVEGRSASRLEQVILRNVELAREDARPGKRRG